MDLDLLVGGGRPGSSRRPARPGSAEAARLYRRITAQAPRRPRWPRPPASSRWPAGLVAAAAAAALVVANLSGQVRAGSGGRLGSR